MEEAEKNNKKKAFTPIIFREASKRKKAIILFDMSQIQSANNATIILLPKVLQKQELKGICHVYNAYNSLCLIIIQSQMSRTQES